MATNTTQKQAAKQFVQDWSGKGYEKGETSSFWIALLQNVFGIQDATKFMEFELPVKTILKEKGSDFIDGYIPSTKVLIEQKGSHVDLSAKARQSDGTELTPYQQARRYAAGLPVSMTPRWIVACNFTTFEVHDMEHPNDAPEVIQLADLEKEYNRLSFLVDDTNVHLKKELEVSIQAGEIVGVLYDKILAQYKDPTNPDSQKALNKLCVRLVFCLYAEDAGIFGSKNMFHDYMQQFEAKDFRKALIELFEVLDTKPEDRDDYMDEDLAAFPYVNGGMFAGEIEIPRITEEIRDLILQRASDDFDWSLISPTIFGAVFESTLNPETRRAGGMHYTSIENIHKVIDPLFLDDLKEELASIKAITVVKTKKEKALVFQDKISKLTFFDPACGSGNFLTESYTCLRRLENEAIRIIYDGVMVMGKIHNPIMVSINQFFGIEINDFACSVAQTALWIAESQMMQETSGIVGVDLDPLPLKTYTNIQEGNALRMDWNEVVSAENLDYIMGNPPFVGLALRNASQQEDMEIVFKSNRRAGRLDYVAAWYRKSIDYIKQNHCQVAFVSTNSISQGEQVPILWNEMFTEGFKIDFAVRPFIWNSEAKEQASVSCVIIGFSRKEVEREKILFDGNDIVNAKNINGYLLDAPNVFIELRGATPEGRPSVLQGSKPWDGGYLLLTPEEKDSLIKEYPYASSFVRRYVGGKDLINNITRYCLWLKSVSPSEYRSIPFIKSRLVGVADIRKQTKTLAVQVQAETPMLFSQDRQPETDYLALPETQSENRKYLPICFLSRDVIASNTLLTMTEASVIDFGILASNIHMIWVKTVAGRLGSSIRYSPAVYNNFPWPSLSDIQQSRILIRIWRGDSWDSYGDVFITYYDMSVLYKEQRAISKKQNDEAKKAAEEDAAREALKADYLRDF